MYSYVIFILSSSIFFPFSLVFPLLSFLAFLPSLPSSRDLCFQTNVIISSGHYAATVATVAAVAAAVAVAAVAAFVAVVAVIVAAVAAASLRRGDFVQRLNGG